MSQTAELCVIVLSYDNEATIQAAVESLLSQDVPLELVVSHSGGGPTGALLKPYGERVSVLESDVRRLPGAARNAGVEATLAPWVAFLAADCVALPGWVAGRLAWHRRGAQAVASAMAPPASSTAALTAYLLQHSSRMPHRDAGPRNHHGLSYSREILERYGPFREDLAHGEDTMLNRRLIDDSISITWAPEIRTGHAYPSKVPALLADRWRRGRLRADLYRSVHQRARLLAHVGLEAPLAVLRAAGRGSPIPPRDLLATLPLLAAASVVGALGVLRGPRRPTLRDRRPDAPSR